MVEPNTRLEEPIGATQSAASLVNLRDLGACQPQTARPPLTASSTAVTRPTRATKLPPPCPYGRRRPCWIFEHRSSETTLAMNGTRDRSSTTGRSMIGQRPFPATRPTWLICTETYLRLSHTGLQPWWMSLPPRKRPCWCTVQPAKIAPASQWLRSCWPQTFNPMRSWMTTWPPLRIWLPCATGGKLRAGTSPWQKHGYSHLKTPSNSCWMSFCPGVVDPSAG